MYSRNTDVASRESEVGAFLRSVKRAVASCGVKSSISP